MSLLRRGLAPCLAFAACLLSISSAAAGELEACRVQPRKVASTLRVADADLGLAPKGLDAVPLADLSPVEDYHPETDRWTERNNRIKTSVLLGVLAWSGEMDLDPWGVAGFRLAWEVPGFIAIRWDSMLSYNAKLETKFGTQTEDVEGTVHYHSISLGIFNPELSISNLAFWAGFGAGLFYYDFRDDDTFGVGQDVDWNDTNLAGNVFFELDYKIVDVFHIGLGFRYHFLLADHTDDGRFYDVGGVSQGGGGGRNDGIVDDLAGVGELTLQIAIVW